MGKCTDWIAQALLYEGDDCLLWPYAPGCDGYGRITVAGKIHQATRYMCAQAHGAPLPGMLATHSCGKGHLGCMTKKHLRWGTPKTNCDDMLLHGTRPAREKHYMTKAEEWMLEPMREMRRAGASQQTIANAFGVTQPTVSQIFTGRHWLVATASPYPRK